MGDRPVAYVYLDDGFADHPKILAISDAALRLYIHALCYANRQLTDGRIPAEFAGHRRRQADQLVKAGLWFTDDPSQGWWIHDYLKYQKPAAKVRDERAKAAEKKRQQRAGTDP
jgi:hypothetical protein